MASSSPLGSLTAALTPAGVKFVSPRWSAADRHPLHLCTQICTFKHLAYSLPNMQVSARLASPAINTARTSRSLVHRYDQTGLLMCLSHRSLRRSTSLLFICIELLRLQLIDMCAGDLWRQLWRSMLFLLLLGNHGVPVHCAMHNKVSNLNNG